MTKDEALKMAIEWVEGWKGIAPSKIELLRVLREALEHPLIRDWKETIDERIAKDDEFKQALAQTAQEPVAYRFKWDEHLQWHYSEYLSMRDYYDSEPLYTHPAPLQNKSANSWQGLSDDEIVKELERLDEYMGKSFFAGVRWAEQALKDKNGKV